MELNSFSAAMTQPEAEIGYLASIEQYREPQTLENSGNNNGQGNINSNSNNMQQSNKKGRPVGSRKKKKETAVVYEEPEDILLPHVITVEDGADIVQSLERFYQSLQVTALYLMSGRGSVANEIISSGDSNSFPPGIYQIISLSGSCLPHFQAHINLVAAYDEKVISGMVQGNLKAAGPVDIVAASCHKPTLIRISDAESFDNPSLVEPPPPSGEGGSNKRRLSPLPEAIGYTASDPYTASPNPSNSTLFRLAAGPCDNPSLVGPRLASPSGEGSSNTKRLCPPFSENILYTASLDSSPYAPSPNPSN